MIETGLASELFLLSFLKPDSGYGLAKRLQNTKKTPNTSKVYPKLKKLTHAGYLRYENKLFHHNPEKLAQEIRSYLKTRNYLLTEEETRILKNLLKNGALFNMLTVDIELQMREQPKGVHAINALEVFCNKIGMLACFNLYYIRDRIPIDDSGTRSFSKTDLGKSSERFDEELHNAMNNILKQMSFKIKGRKSVRSKKMESVTLLSNFYVSLIMSGFIFEKMSESTIKKFCLLWNENTGFRMGVLLSEIPKKPIDFENMMTEISTLSQKFQIN